MSVMTHRLVLELGCVNAGYHLKARSRLGEAEADLVLPFTNLTAD